mmetsp:Transcript_32277/g.35754  ORF Transcript_32277/g.35754 Transcript_32277/m.35754 type:complete len:271 (-) Transcript_32277:50-862(-)
MKSQCFRLLVLLAASNFNNVLAHDDDNAISCGCASDEHNFKIDCSDQDYLTTALFDIQNPNYACKSNCTSDICKTNYYIIQSHHDYCFYHELSELVTSVYHDYQPKCMDCHIHRKNNPDIYTCPVPDCSDEKSSIQAYNFLILNQCKSDCSKNGCAYNFRTLRSVYDGCSNDSMNKLIKLGVNTYSDYCHAEDCNVDHGSGYDANMLKCGFNGKSGAMLFAIIFTVSIVGIILIGTVIFMTRGRQQRNQEQKKAANFEAGQQVPTENALA